MGGEREHAQDAQLSHMWKNNGCRNCKHENEEILQQEGTTAQIVRSKCEWYCRII